MRNLLDALGGQLGSSAGKVLFAANGGGAVQGWGR
jgi:hypothetical protein